MRLFLTLLALASASVAAPLKVDLNQHLRGNAADPAFERWDITGGSSMSETFDGVTITFTPLDPPGSQLGSTWYKTYAESATLNAKMVSDGLRIDGATAGAAMEMRIAGLAAGRHTLLTYHNQCDNPTAGPFSPIHIELDGVLVVDALRPSVRVDDNSKAPVAYLEFDALAGMDTVVRFLADTSDPADVIQNVVLNGFEIDTPNSSRQAQEPSPADGDRHVDADDGDVMLSWSAAAAGSTVSHDLYFGTDAGALSSATRSSPEFVGNQNSTTHLATGLDSRTRYHWRVDEIDDLGNTTRGDVWSFRPRHLAFPGAEGYGRHAMGGRYGRTVVVSSLDDDPANPQPGTLRHAIEIENGPRTIIFDIGGLITLESKLTLTDDRITIAGQTAPGKGICVRGHTLGLSGAEDAIVRHLRVRPGDISGTTIDGMGLAGCDHCILDHCSISWTIDEAFSSRSARNISLQRTLISEALNVAGHQNYPPGTRHGYAASISGDVGSFHHNLLAHCYGRNWSLAGGLDGDGFFAGRLDIRNNVVYNWGRRTTDGGAMEVNFFGNYYKPGAATEHFYALTAQYDNFPGTQRYYFAGNVMPGHFDETNQSDGRTEAASDGGSLPTYENFVDSPFFPPFVETQTAAGAYKQVLSDVGCTRPVIDDHDLRVISETRNGTTSYQGGVSGLPGLPDSQEDVGGWEHYPTVVRPPGWDTDRDGLPDWWETLHGSDPQSSAGDFSDANADSEGDGYTALEDYLHWCASTHTRSPSNGTVDLDLAPHSRGYTAAPVYAFSDSSHCSVALMPDGTTARISSEAGYRGIASFTVTVADAAGDSMSFPVLVHVDDSFPTPVLSLDLEESTTGYELLATTPAGSGMVIETSNDLSSWRDHVSFPGDDATRVITLPEPVGERPTFYRLRTAD